MGGFAANTHSKIKQVMRTALVGVAPADQLMLKGYLRVLLRLEADLEWVPANHPQVDLLFINEDFRNSDSVQKLLANTDKPILFVKRNQNGQGGLDGDTVVIPIKELSALNKWLMQNVAVLKSSDKKSADLAGDLSKQQSSHTVPSSSNTRLKNTAQSDNTLSDKSKKSAFNTAASVTSNSDAILIEGVKRLIEFAKLVHQRPNGAYEFIVNNVRVGIADLNRQKLWLSQENIEFDDTWQLKPTSDALPQGHSVDLFQWIWLKIWMSPKEMPLLISDNKAYQIKYWPKPAKDNRTAVLRIFTALEQSPQRIDNIVNLADTSKTIIRKVLTGLLLSGGLQARAYDELSILETISTDSTNISSKPNNSEVVSKPAVSTGSALDDALQRRAAGHSTSVGSTVDINIDKPSTTTRQQPSEPAPSQAPEKSEKLGFLSRLRKKLGL